MNNASRTLNEELEAKDQQIQELKEELAKCQRREKILEFMTRVQESNRWLIGYYAGLRGRTSGICDRIKSILSKDDLHDVLRAYLEEEMERDYNEWVKPLKDKLDALK